MNITIESTTRKDWPILIEVKINGCFDNSDCGVSANDIDWDFVGFSRPDGRVFKGCMDKALFNYFRNLSEYLNEKVEQEVRG